MTKICDIHPGTLYKDTARDSIILVLSNCPSDRTDMWGYKKRELLVLEHYHWDNRTDVHTEFWPEDYEEYTLFTFLKKIVMK
jgi:uncharacterized protein YcgI (DUF1989 family)